jgi:acyl-CoA thioesterase I
MTAVSKFINSLMNAVFLPALLLWAGSCKNNHQPANPSAKNADTAVRVAAPAKAKTILFFGNSLTAGYGVDPSEAFPALIQDRIDSLHLGYKVVNGGVSGETSAGGNARVDWILRQPVDIFVLELGGNDGLRGIPLSETKKNLQAIIDKVKAKYPAAKLVLAGMQIPPNMGQTYAAEFKRLYPDLAEKNKISLIQFLLKDVGGIGRLNQQDGIHPTAEGHKIVAENVWSVLKDIL